MAEKWEVNSYEELAHVFLVETATRVKGGLARHTVTARDGFAWAAYLAFVGVGFGTVGMMLSQITDVIETFCEEEPALRETVDDMRALLENVKAATPPRPDPPAAGSA